MWRNAFEKDAGGAGTLRSAPLPDLPPVDNEHEVMLHLDFDSATDAGAFLDTLRTKVWPSQERAPAKVGEPKTHILDLVDSREY